MKLDHADNKAMTSEEFKTVGFRVDQKMAQIIFRDKLYSAQGRIRIIVQEYMANARDAHRAAGKSDTPIEVRLPSSLDPEFVVRDFGCGISPEVVNDIFVVYGASTKNQTNDMNGGYGIGAKCAFSYVSAFAVTTTVKGIRYIYSAFIDNDGMNQFTLLDTGPATGPDGTEIRIPVKASDHIALRGWFTDITHAWTPRPNLIGAQVHYLQPTVLEQDANWMLCDGSKDSSYIMQGSPIIVLVDDIPYALNEVQATETSSDVAQLFRALIDTQIKCVMKFHIAEITVPPNREAVDLTVKTKNALTLTVLAITQHVIASSRAKVMSADTLDKILVLLGDKDKILSLARKVSSELFNSEIKGTFDPDKFGMEVYTGRKKGRRFIRFDELAEVRLAEVFQHSTSTFYLLIKNESKRLISLAAIKQQCKGWPSGSVTVVVIDNDTKLAELKLTEADFANKGFKIIEELEREKRPSRGAITGYRYLDVLDATVFGGSDGQISAGSMPYKTKIFVDAAFLNSQVFVKSAMGEKVLIKGHKLDSQEACRLHAYLAWLLEQSKKPIGCLSTVKSHVYLWAKRLEQSGATCTKITFLDKRLDTVYAELLTMPLCKTLEVALAAHMLEPVLNWISNYDSADVIKELYDAHAHYSDDYVHALTVASRRVRIDRANAPDFRKADKQVLSIMGKELQKKFEKAISFYELAVTEFMRFVESKPLLLPILSSACHSQEAKHVKDGVLVRLDPLLPVKGIFAAARPRKTLFRKEKP